MGDTRDNVRRILDGYTMAKKAEYDKIPPGSMVRYFVRLSEPGVKPIQVKLVMGGMLLKNENDTLMIKMFGKNLAKKIYVVKYTSIYKLYYKVSVSYRNKMLEERNKELERDVKELKSKLNDCLQRVSALEKKQKKSSRTAR